MTAPAAEAAQSGPEQPAPAGSRDATAPAAAPKSNWEAAELARRAAAGRPSRAPADTPAGAQFQQERGDEAAPPSHSAAESRQAGQSTAVDPSTALGERPDGDPGVLEGNALPAAAQKAAAIRRNDEDRIAAVRERFLARKRKVADV